MSAPSARGKVIMNFEVTPEQKEAIAENAAWFNMTPTEFVRHAALGNTLDLAHYRQRERYRKHMAEAAA